MTIFSYGRTPVGVPTEVPAAVRRSRPPRTFLWWGGRLLACGGLFFGATAAPAQEGAHRHGDIRMEVALEAGNLTVRVDAPLDSLLGFEHRPRTDSQRRAAEALLARMRNAATLLVPSPAAQCRVKDVAVEAEVLSTAKVAGTRQQEEKHEDLEATYTFDCLSPDKLQLLEVGLFGAFARVQRIDVRVVSSRGQSGLTLRRPQKLVRIGQ